MKKFIRTFHPVGHGAFYTEEHNFGKSSYSIVYDCGGGKSLIPNKCIKEEINKFSVKCKNVDVLFISHFHYDHINGVSYLKSKCNIKTVVLPLLDDKEKNIYKAIYYNTEYFELIDNPSTYFGNETRVVIVNSFNGNIDQKQPIDINIDNLTDGQIIENGTPIIQKYWRYIPFNYKDETFKNKLIDRINSFDLRIEDIDEILKDENKIKKIKEEYESLIKDQNVFSLIVYSGSICSLKIRCNRFFKIESGCVYFGDINLNSRHVISDLSQKLSLYLLNVAVIQIPHHGSERSFNSRIIDIFENLRCAVISYGTEKTHEHPSKTVIKEIRKNGKYCHRITEKKKTRLVQISKRSK